MKNISLLISITLVLVSCTSSKTIPCGLISKIRLEKKATRLSIEQADIYRLQEINKALHADSYLNKVYLVGGEKWMISYYTEGTYEYLKNTIQQSHFPFNYFKEYKDPKSGVTFLFIYGKFGESYVKRIIFTEKGLTVTIILDLIDDGKGNNEEAVFYDIVSSIQFFEAKQ